MYLQGRIHGSWGLGVGGGGDGAQCGVDTPREERERRREWEWEWEWEWEPWRVCVGSWLMVCVIVQGGRACAGARCGEKRSE